MSGAAARIVVTEPWAVLRQGLISVLHGVHTIVEELEDVRLLPTVLAQARADVVVVGGGRGIDLHAAVSEVAEHASTDARVIVLCDQLDADDLRAILRAGAKGVLSKKVDGTQLLASIEQVLRGDRVIDQRFLPLLFEVHDPDAGSDVATGPLTAREHEVLVELSRRASNRQIADALLVAESTVKSHLANIYAKLEVPDRHRAIARAVELGLLS